MRLYILVIILFIFTLSYPAESITVHHAPQLSENSEVDVLLFLKSGSDKAEIYIRGNGNYDIVIGKPGVVQLYSLSLSSHFTKKQSVYLHKDTPSVFIIQALKPGTSQILLMKGRSAKASIKVCVGVEFLLTFDDGPSLKQTPKILDILENPGKAIPDKNIKAVFFIKKDNARFVGENEENYLEILHRMNSSGHVFGFHDYGSEIAWNHKGTDHISRLSHDASPNLQDAIRSFNMYMSNHELQIPDYVRPPLWKHNQSVLNVYDEFDLNMILTDIRSRDGGNPAGNILIWRRYIKMSLWKKAVNRIHSGVGEIVVTFHDTNKTTADNLRNYLSLLRTGALRAGVAPCGIRFVNETSRVKEILASKSLIYNQQIK